MNTTRRSTETPDISIIVPALNCKEIIRGTITSVNSQRDICTQLVVIDGGSTDGTQREIENSLPASAEFISESDSGIFDAMNKGVDRSVGRYIYFLGAGDSLLSDNSLRLLFEQGDDHTDLIFGNVVYDDGRIFSSSLNWRLLFHNSLHHQGCIYSRRVFESFRYDPRMKICADYELNLTLWLQAAKFKRVNQVVARAPSGGVSTRASSIRRVMSELQQIRCGTLPAPAGQILSIAENLRCEITMKRLISKAGGGCFSK